MTEPHPTVKQYHAVHRMLNGFTSYMKMKMHDGHIKEVLSRIEKAFEDVGFWEDGHPKLINID